MEPLTIVADTREQAPFQFDGAGYDGVNVVTKKLDVGDYSVLGLEDVVACERKSMNDLAFCLGTDRPRFIRQLQRGRSLESYCVVVEGSWQDLAAGNYAARGLHPHAACQSVASFVSRLHVPFMFAGSRTAAEYVCWSFLRQFAMGLRHRLRAVEQAMSALQPPKVVPNARVVRMP